jgi:hypothetical protein
MNIVEIIYWLSIAETFAGSFDRIDFAQAREMIHRGGDIRAWLRQRRRGIAQDRHDMRSPNPITRALVPVERRRRVVLVWLMRQADRAIRHETQ